MKLPTPKYLFNKISENITKVTWTRQKLKLNKEKKISTTIMIFYTFVRNTNEKY